tara:strand:- start:256 stop:741 length:486 start_codon:yes stop_codon:yes gene_type:complete
MNFQHIPLAEETITIDLAVANSKVFLIVVQHYHNGEETTTIPLSHNEDYVAWIIKNMDRVVTFKDLRENNWFIAEGYRDPANYSKELLNALFEIDSMAQHMGHQDVIEKYYLEKDAWFVRKGDVTTAGLVDVWFDYPENGNRATSHRSLTADEALIYDVCS